MEFARKYDVTRLYQLHFRLTLKTVVRHWIWIFLAVSENLDRLAKAIGHAVLELLIKQYFAHFDQ